VCVCVGVENIDDGIFADREHQAVSGLGATELVQVGLELLGLTAQIYGLAEEAALDKKIRIRLAYFESFAAGISRHAKGVASLPLAAGLRLWGP
jgi:hypothetical protein